MVLSFENYYNLYFCSSENNIVYGFGDNSDGQLGQSVADVSYSDVPIEVTRFNDKNIIQLSAGSYHTAVLIGLNCFAYNNNSNIKYIDRLIGRHSYIRFDLYTYYWVYIYMDCASLIYCHTAA